MNKRSLLFLAIYSIICVTCARAQRENVWAFGGGAGLDFNSGSPVAITTAMTTGTSTVIPYSIEACASVCDASGQLLFYTDGTWVWNRNHQLMSNGINLTQLPYTTAYTPTMSSSQGTLIVPMPDSADKYYVFSLTSVEVSNYSGRLYYSIIDMQLNGGLGDVMPERKGVLVDSNLLEKMTAVVGDNCDIWVLACSRQSKFKAYEITAAGINKTPVISNVGLGNTARSLGCMIASPDRKKLAATQCTSGGLGSFGAYLYNFDAATGLVSIPEVVLVETYGAYGLCFSDDNSKLYIGAMDPVKTPGYLYQFDISSGDSGTIAASKTLIGAYYFGDLKLAPDGKIYFPSRTFGLNNGAIDSLGAINFPNAAGTACGYSSSVITMLPGTYAGIGLPNVVPVIKKTTAHSYQTITSGCFAANALMTASDTTGKDYIWSDGVTGKLRTAGNAGMYVLTYHTQPCVVHTDTFYIAFPFGQLPAVTVVNSCKNAKNGIAIATNMPTDTTDFSYTWRNRNNIIVSTSDSLTNAMPGIYTLQITTEKGCDTTIQITIPGNTVQDASFVVDSIVCVNEAVTFHNTSGNSYINYLWLLDETTTSTMKDPVHAYNTPGTYHVSLIAATARPCADTVTKTIIVDARGNGDFMIDEDSICAGNKIFLSPVADTSRTQLRWSFSDGIIATTTGSISRAFDLGGDVSIQLTTSYRACPDTTRNHTVYVLPYPVVNIGPDTTICTGNALELRNQATTLAGAYKWNTGVYTEKLTVTQPGVYSLTVTSTNGCASTDTVWVKKSCYLDIPNAFTPNGDGINDYFFPKTQLSGGLQQFSMQIISRWGQLIFETNNKEGRGWDGSYNGVAQPEGVYIYKIEAVIDNSKTEQYQGNITLIR